MDKINNPHYLYRMTVLVAISLLAPVVGSEATCQTMLPVVINAAKDRFTFCVILFTVLNNSKICIQLGIRCTGL